MQPKKPSKHSLGRLSDHSSPAVPDWEKADRQKEHVLKIGSQVFLGTEVDTEAASQATCLTAHLLAPPASGETMVQFFHSGIFSLIHFSTAGSAYKLSTGISKKPCRKTRGTDVAESHIPETIARSPLYDQACSHHLSTAFSFPFYFPWCAGSSLWDTQNSNARSLQSQK